jgi:ribosome-binding factor A
MTTGKRRPERVAALVQEVLADSLTRELKDPRVGFTTVTGVEVSPDCTHAEVRVSILGSDEEKDRTMEGLRSATGFLRSRLARTLSMRSTPEIHFVLDRGLEHQARIDRLLNQIKSEDPS